MRILYFASLRETLGCDQETLDTGANSVESLIEQLSARGDIWAEQLQRNDRLQIAVNQSLARRNTPLSPDDEVAFFPPVTGG